MNIVHRTVYKSLLRRNFHKNAALFTDSLYEPTYLESTKSKLPMYDTLNIQMRGYDFPVLESYQKFLHNTLKNLDIDIEEAWATPHQELQVTTLKPKSEVVNAEYRLKIYERTVQITDVISSQLSLVLRVLEASTPAGVTVQVVPHEDYHEEVRYVPDTELKTLKQELEDMGGPSRKK